jgi:putative endonuclease
MYYVYVLRGPKQLYTGSTNDLKRRIAEHSEGKSFVTKGKGPWVLVYYEACVAEKDARLRVKYLKTAWGKRYLKGRLQNDT